MNLTLWKSALEERESVIDSPPSRAWVRQRRLGRRQGIPMAAILEQECCMFCLENFGEEHGVKPEKEKPREKNQGKKRQENSVRTFVKHGNGAGQANDFGFTPIIEDW